MKTGEDVTWIPASDGRVEFPLDPLVYQRLDPTPDHANAEQIALAIKSWVGLLADSPLATSRLKPKRTIKRFLYELLNGGFRSMIARCAVLADELVSTPVRTDEGSTTGAFLTAMKNLPIFREYMVWHRTGNVQAFDYVYTFLVHLKKMPFEDPEFNRVALKGWFEVEERLSDLVLPNWVDDLRPIIAAIVPGKDSLREMLHRPKFGPGAVAEPGIRGELAKLEALAYDPYIDRAFYGEGARCFGLSHENGFHKDYALREIPWNKARMSIRTAKLKFVPKNYKTARSICMEPNVYMLHQQSILSWLVDGMSRGYARELIRIDDQGRNRRLSHYGSATGLYDTLDLSSASDSVHWKLVSRIFPRHVAYYLLATRTKRVDLGGGYTTRVNKFAPMGSALCFPVQTIIYTAVTILSAIRRLEAVPLNERVGDSRLAKYLRNPLFVFSGNYEGGRSLSPAVYGDDIVADHRDTATIIHLLTDLGFVINKGKSFVGDQLFRESCGAYYLDGQDVTPLYYSVALSGRKSPEWLASSVDQVNRSRDHARHSCASVLHRHVRSTWRNILYSDDRSVSVAFYSRRPRNEHLKKSYNANWHRSEYESVGIVERKVVGVDNPHHAWIDVLDRKTGKMVKRLQSYMLESYLYVQYWNSKSGASRPTLSGKASSRRIPGETRTTRRWTPAW